MKYNASGTQVWARQFGTAEADSPTAWRPTRPGSTSSDTPGCVPGRTAKGAGDGYVRKYTPTGDTAWTVQFGTKAADGPTNVAVGPGGVSVIGWTNGTFADQHRHGQADAFLLQLDTSGTRMWVREFGSAEYEIPTVWRPTRTGSSSTGSRTGRCRVRPRTGMPTRSSRLRTRRFPPMDAPVRHDNVRRRVGERVHGVVYITGSTSGALAGQTNRGSGDAYLRAYTANGSGLWTRQFGTDKGEAGIAVAADPTGIYVTGGTAGRFGHQPNP